MASLVICLALFQRKSKLHVGGWQAALVVAGHEFEIAGELGFAMHFYALGESRLAGKFHDVHHEKFIVAFVFVAFFRGFTHQFGFGVFFKMKRSGNGAFIGLQKLRIDVPAILDMSGENEVVFTGANLSGFVRPFDGIELPEGCASRQNCH